MKKIKLYALVIFLLIGIPISVAFAFNDTSGSRNESAINYLYEKGVVEGYDDGSYKPSNKINRAEFTKILIESKYPGEATGSDCFLDVKGDWYAKYVCYAKQLNIVDGYGDGTFGPGNYINLAEALKIVLETYDIEFTQYSEQWVWYVPYEKTAEDLALLNYVYTDIDEEINRGEMAQLVYNVEMYLEGENENEITYANDKECFLYDDTESYVYDYRELLEDYDYDVFYTDDEVTSEDGCAVYAGERYEEEEREMVCDLSDDNETYFYGYAGDIDLDEFSVNFEYEVSSEEECAAYAEYHYGGDHSEIPNVVFLEFDENDEWRGENTGNVAMEGLIERFYDEYPDDFDMMLVINVGDYNDQENGWSDGLFRRYAPSNIGRSIEDINVCGTPQNPDCEGYPDRLRYIQQTGDNFSAYIFMHELGHYWSAPWYTEKSDENACYEDWVSAALYNNHWTSLSVLGETTSPISYWLENEDGSRASYGEVVDNGDGTFTYDSYMGPDPRDEKFNYIDLYAMGLMSEEELNEKEMYVIVDAKSVNDEGVMFSGTRVDVTLEDFKNLLFEKEACEGTGADYYYTGDGDRELHGHDNGEEFADDLRVAIVLLKHPDQPVYSYDAYTICEAVNYIWPEAWNNATYGLSEINLKIDGDDPSPDCAELYVE